MTNEIKHFPESVQKLLIDARIPIEQLKPIYYELSIGEKFPDDSIRLIEINNSLIEELEKNNLISKKIIFTTGSSLSLRKCSNPSFIASSIHL